MTLGIAVNPSIHLNKVSDKAWDRALEENIIAKDHVLADDLALILLTHHWKQDLDKTVPLFPNINRIGGTLNEDCMYQKLYFLIQMEIDMARVFQMSYYSLS